MVVVVVVGVVVVVVVGFFVDPIDIDIDVRSCSK